MLVTFYAPDKSPRRDSASAMLAQLQVRSKLDPPSPSKAKEASTTAADPAAALDGDGGGNDSGPDDSDVEEATSTAALPSLFSRVHVKKLAWRTLRDVIVETNVFDTTVQPGADAGDSAGVVAGLPRLACVAW